MVPLLKGLISLPKRLKFYSVNTEMTEKISGALLCAMYRIQCLNWFKLSMLLGNASSVCVIFLQTVRHRTITDGQTLSSIYGKHVLIFSAMSCFPKPSLVRACSLYWISMWKHKNRTKISHLYDDMPMKYRDFIFI